VITVIKQDKNLKGVDKDMKINNIDSKEYFISFKVQSAEKTNKKNSKQENYDIKDKTIAEGQSKAIQGNKIVIKKIEKKEQDKKATYYLGEPLIERINKTAEYLNIGKSALVKFLLEVGLELLEIED
jgi:hypothetical protein